MNNGFGLVVAVWGGQPSGPPALDPLSGAGRMGTKGRW